MEKTMQRVISISNPQQSSEPLGDRLDATISVTSNDIGNLIGELVNRSLKVGVSDLGDSLAEFAEEQVDQAVQKHMPVITEAADAIAQSTAKLVVHQSVTRISEEITNQRQTLESKIEAAESNAFDRSRAHMDEAVSVVQVKIDETRSLAIQGQDTSAKKIQLLRERGKQTWQKFQGEFASINEAYSMLREEHESLRLEHGKLRGEHAGLVEKLALIEKGNQQHAQRSQQQHSAVLQQHRLLEERLAVLEQPRGLKGLIAKFRGGGKTSSADNPNAPSEVEPTE